eukprot:2033354-Amphidinium_carterae.1
MGTLRIAGASVPVHMGRRARSCRPCVAAPATLSGPFSTHIFCRSIAHDRNPPTYSRSVVFLFFGCCVAIRRH